MRKLLLVGIFALSLFGGSAFAQEEQQQSAETRCMPFDKMAPKIRDQNYSPVFMGINNNHVSIAIIKDSKTNQWIMLHFIYSQAGIIACQVDRGDDLAVMKELDTPKTEGL